MSVKEIRDVLQQLNEPNEFIMEEVNLADVNHYIWKISNCNPPISTKCFKVK